MEGTNAAPLNRYDRTARHRIVTEPLSLFLCALFIGSYGKVGQSLLLVAFCWLSNITS